MEYKWPVILKFGDIMDEAKFFRLCHMNELVDFERDSDGNVGFGCSAGFMLPNKAVRSPDASWIKMEKWNRLSRDEKESFAPVCPDFVAELRHGCIDLNYLLNKMREYIDNGVQLGWLIDRFDKKAYIYRADGSVEIVGINAVLSGEKVLPDFSLSLYKLVHASQAF